MFYLATSFSIGISLGSVLLLGFIVFVGDRITCLGTFHGWCLPGRASTRGFLGCFLACGALFGLGCLSVVLLGVPAVDREIFGAK